MKYTPDDLKRIRKSVGLNQSEMAQKLGLTREMVSNMETGSNPMSSSTQIILGYIESEFSSQKSKEGKILLYPDVGPAAGSSFAAEEAPPYGPAAYIDAGDLFPGATAAFRHYGKNMSEYPSGCIVLLKELSNRDFIWGEDYVIEWASYRTLTRVQKGTKGFIRAYSTHPAVYSDGTPVYQPIDIPLKNIQRAFLVLGHVIKRHSQS